MCIPIEQVLYLSMRYILENKFVKYYTGNVQVHLFDASSIEEFVIITQPHSSTIDLPLYFLRHGSVKDIYFLK